MEFELFPREIGGARVTSTKAGWRLELAAGDRHGYRLAQVDDYAHLGKRQFKYSPLWRLRLRARVSRADIPGTWGFGLWNDPFGFSIGFGGKKKQLPALPQVAWFMHASEPNWLSFEDSPAQGTRNRLPGNGFFAGTLRSRRMPSMLFVLAAPLLPAPVQTGLAPGETTGQPYLHPTGRNQGRGRCSCLARIQRGLVEE
jgi:hypothetical protein